MTTITFIIPVLHPDNCPDWRGLIDRLRQTLASVAAQTHDDWRGIVVANEGAELPALPAKFTVERVDLPPNPRYDMAIVGRDAAYDAVRLDKGSRILAGMRAAGESTFFMTVDDDDFVSARIVQYAADHGDANGWTIDKGFVWSEGGALMQKHDDFSSYCGTSLIIRSDLYDLPKHADASADFIKTMLGSHVRIATILAERGTPLGTLPFRGAIYRVGHSGAHSRSQALWRSIIQRSMLRHPMRIVRALAGLRRLSPAIRREFFG